METTEDYLLPYCSKCKQFISKSHFRAHKCESATSVKYKCVLSNLTGKSGKFEKVVLPPVKNDEIGLTVLRDELILQLGMEEFNKCSNDQKEKSHACRTRSFMRTIASLSIETKLVAKNSKKNLETSDIFKRRNMKYLEEGIENVYQKGMELTSKKYLGYALKTAAIALKALYLLNDDDGEAQEVSNFLTCLKERWKYVFKASETASQVKRIEHTRRPASLPEQKDLEILRCYLADKLNDLHKLKMIPSKMFAYVRRLMVSRLVLLNYRRANEASKMTLREMNDALSGVWIRNTTAEEDVALDNYYIGYVSAKNPQKPVDVIIPKSEINLIKYLMNEKVRSEAGIPADNTFVFASLHSKYFASGYHDFKFICNEANVSMKSSSMRHFISTIRAKKSGSEEDVELFVEHMGHSKEINKNVYQIPRAKQTLKVVGNYLHETDQMLLGNCSNGNQSEANNETYECSPSYDNNIALSEESCSNDKYKKTCPHHSRSVNLLLKDQ